MKVPEKYYDEIFNFRGQWDMPSACGLKIIEKGGKVYVIVTELYQDNPGTSVASAGRSLAEQICGAKNLDFGTIMYIECNPATNSKLSFYGEEYFEVNFTGGPRPVYRQLSPKEAAELFVR
jgi:hypothetical protein